MASEKRKRRTNIKSCRNPKNPIEFDKEVFPKNIRWQHDFDYLNRLSPKEKRFMAKFIREYINGNVKKGDRSALHKTKALRKDCYSRKNAANRDLYAIMGYRGIFAHLEDLPDSGDED